MELHERLAVFFERLDAAPPVATADDALALVCRLIEEVEEEFCPLPRKDPPPRRATGRMYAPQPDSIIRSPAGIIHATTAGHLIVCNHDGSISITRRRNVRSAFRKPGARS